MNTATILKRAGSFLLDVLEIYIPALSFTVMFLVFMLQVFFRYFLNNPLTWPPEIISLTFIWTTVLGACYAQRKADHVSFTIVYDRISAKGQLIFRLLGNGFIAIAFLIAWKPAYDYVTFMNFQETTVLKISYTVVYAPFLIFLTLIIGRMLHAVYDDTKILFGKAELVRDEGSTEPEMAVDLLEDVGQIPNQGSNHGV